MSEHEKIPIRNTDGLALWAACDAPYNPDDNKETRSVFKHDGDVITYSPSFRRLSNKSQIVIKPERHGHFRSRLTHTLEVMRTAESIGIPLGLNTNLIDAIALGHDLGHSPFGHAGERAFQMIMRNDVLPNCDQDKLKAIFQNIYKIENIGFESNGELINDHWLFHHAINSVRILQRKMRDVGDFTNDGILKHGWSPWQLENSNKFGIPKTYEGQVVAIADQVAGINHDIEDILSSRQSLYTAESIRHELPAYISAEISLNFSKAQDILDQWFLPVDADIRSAWMRKKRLQAVINSVIKASKSYLISAKVESNEEAGNQEKALCIEEDMGQFLKGYEIFLRKNILDGPWFHNRDCAGGAIVQTVYSFFRFGREEDLPENIQSTMAKFRKSVDEPYDKDNHFRLFRDSAKNGKAQEIVEIIKAIDFVSGMTDDYIMNNHKVSLEYFNKPCAL